MASAQPPAENDPTANRDAVVQSGNARFTMLTGRLLRMEWSPDGIFEDRGTLLFINRNLAVPGYSVDSSGEMLTILTSSLTLRYRKYSGMFTPENLSVSFDLGGNVVEWRPGMTDTANLKGTTRTLDGTNGANDVTLEDGILSRSGWSVVDDSRRPLFDGSEPNWVIPRPAGGAQDWYFFGYGHNYKQALFDFTRVAGKIPMPPRFAFGYWWSRYWTYSDAELRELVGEMERYGVPIDVLVIDMDWHETSGLSSRDMRRDPAGEMVGWTGYTWNKRLFPDPDRFLRWTKERGLRTALNLHPASGIPPMEERYSDFASAYGFDTTGGPYIPFSIEDRKWTRTYFDVILRPIERQGIDFWWLDWQAWPGNRKIPDLSNTFWLNHVFFTEMDRSGERRPLLFHRWGGLGNHRYQIGFSGDSWSTWEALSYQPYFTSTAGNVGYGYWSHDIGGHVGNDPDPELYLRWLQWGIFSPIVRTHSTKSATIERRIWKYTGYFESMRSALELRYQMNPYIYTAARQAFDSGISLCRPMYYDYPESDGAYSFTGQYLFGDALLVAPVTSRAAEETGLAMKEIWLPPGEWYEWPAGTLTDGDRVIHRTYTPGEIPVFARADAVLPMYPQVSRLDRVPDTLILAVMPGQGGNGGGVLYEDDGATSDYRSGSYALTKFTKETIPGSSGRVRITVLPREGTYAGISESRSYEVRFPSTLPPSHVRVNGDTYPFSMTASPASWTFEGSRLTTVVRTPPVGCDRTVTLEITWPPGDTGSRDLLNGKIGLLGRMPEIIETMKNEVNLRDQIANAPSSVLKAGSLGKMIDYRPDLCRQYLREFDEDVPRLVWDIAEYPGGDPLILEKVVSLLSAGEMVSGKPSIIVDTTSSARPVSVRMSSPARGAQIRYTLDGSEPVEASAAYTGPFRLRKTAEVRAKTFERHLIPSFTVSSPFHLNIAASLAYESPVSPKYDGGNPMALTDGAFGSVNDFRSGWVGIQGNDLVVTLKLTEPRDIVSLALRCLRNQGSWIFLPSEVVFEVSSDGTGYRAIGNTRYGTESLRQEPLPGAKMFQIPSKASGVSFIRVRAKNAGPLPPWHPGAGNDSWLFADEIIVELSG